MSIELDPRSHWSFADRSPYPWAKVFAEKVSRIDLPILTGPWLQITSDSSGMSRESRFWVTTFLVVDMNNSWEWEEKRQIVRQEYLNDGRRMAFKALNDKQRQKALVPFLSAANLINGLCFSVVIDKRIQSICTGKEILFDRRFPEVFEGKWNLRSFEHMFRVVHFFSMLVAGLSHDNQDISWITDNEDFLATPGRTRDTQRVLSAFTSLYANQRLGKLGFGSTELDEADRRDEDLAAIPDLVAGSVCETMSVILKHYGRIPAVPTVLETRTSKKSDLIMSWFFGSQNRLKKAAFSFEYRAHNHYRIGTFALG